MSVGSATRGENVARLALWLLCQPGERCRVRLCYCCCICQKRKTCLQFLQLVESSSSLLARALPTLGSANSMHSETQQGSWCHKQDEERYTHILLHYLKNIYICLFCCVYTAAATAAAAVASVVFDSVRPHRRQPTRVARPWDSPRKNTGVGCHFLLQCMKVKSESEVAQSCPTSRPHGLQPTRLLRPWDFPGKSTGVGCHCSKSGVC